MESSWGERHMRRLLRRRPPTWMVWVWIFPAVASAIAAVLQAKNGIEAAVTPALAASFCLFLTRYTFELQRFHDIVTRLETDNAELRGRLQS